MNINNPSASAFVQQRSKIKFDAFQWLFQSINSKTYKSQNNLYKGYRLLTVDRCTVPIRTDIDDKITYFVNHKNGKEYNAYHLNASYDLMEHTYDDVIIQDGVSKDENESFCKLADRYKEKKLFL